MLQHASKKPFIEQPDVEPFQRSFSQDYPPAEKESFKKEFQTLLIRTYSKAFVEFKEWSVKFLLLNLEEDERKAY